MRDTISDFKKTKRFLVCVDSDGCAMDTMDIKHQKCFGPKAIEQWGLESIESRFMEVWNNINLYSKTRGTNRFKGLVSTLQLLKAEGYAIPDFDAIVQWVENSNELSNRALEKEIEHTNNEQLKKALAWSNAVNEAISSLEQGDKPFSGVKEGLDAMASTCDIVIVSSANGAAVVSEWTRHKLSPYVQVMLGQEAGSKAYCISELKKNNYTDEEILMVGDSPGDLDAAIKNQVLFYPILVGKEKFSWERLATSAMEMFLKGSYSGDYQQKLIDEFYSNFK